MASRASVLILNPHSEELAKQFWPDGELTTWTGNPLRPPSNYKNRFEHVFAYQVLQLAWNDEAQEVLERWQACLKEGGELHIFVPALEWAVNSYNIDDQPKNLWGHLYGFDKKQPHHGIWDMRLLRADCMRADLAVVEARAISYEIEIGGESYQAGLHYVHAVKRRQDGEDRHVHPRADEEEGRERLGKQNGQKAKKETEAQDGRHKEEEIQI